MVVTARDKKGSASKWNRDFVLELKVVGADDGGAPVATTRAPKNRQSGGLHRGRDDLCRVAGRAVGSFPGTGLQATLDEYSCALAERLRRTLCERLPRDDGVELHFARVVGGEAHPADALACGGVAQLGIGDAAAGELNYVE
jgi:hypothetical protein